ncbi:spermatogenesis-associated protein 46 [Heterocephalus glaber]|uniref:Spermatogenesis-associated protein 46 n=1 Tax=Heterocephalus glaber TaxID=10181 RepID=A0AAX6Q167_HETGA|nr:spermatogenesis-associated protein 46 [Heterocephalus glaber]
MENFSFLSISGPRISSSAQSTFPGILSSCATSLPDIAKPTVPKEAANPAQSLPLQYQRSALRHGVHSIVPLPDCISGETPNGKQLRQNCIIYRPWFSPYSYFVRLDKESHLEACSLPEVEQVECGGASSLLEDVADSSCSSSSSPENTCPLESTRKVRHSLDSVDYITSQDILMASKWYPAQQNGYKCAACCRMYPTLHSLKSHIRWGFKEGFSCRVYYRKLKALWGREQKAWPGDRLSLGSCQAFK